MDLLKAINDDIKSAMRAREKEKLEALRAVKAAILLEQTKGSDTELSETTAITLLQRLVKQRKDSAQTYQEQGREDLAAPERIQAGFIEAYLPAQMSDEELSNAIAGILTKVGATTPADMGKAMGAASKELAGKADNKRISQLIKELLNN